MADSIARYLEFVKANPTLASELEAVLRWVSYFTAGRFGKSAVLSELLYSSSSLLTLLNDTILRRAANVPAHLNEVVDRLQTCLAVVEYVEVFGEIAALHLSGPGTRWVIIVILQIIKTIIRLALLLYHQQGIQRSPPIQPLNRHQVLQPNSTGESDASSTQDGTSMATYSLRHSGRVVRTLAAAPPVSRRSWRLPTPLGGDNCSSSLQDKLPSTKLTGAMLAAEVVHVLRPLTHLSAVGVLGEQSWAPWLVAAAMDVGSLQVLSNGRASLHYRERVELNRRLLLLVFYLLRSPFYDRFTKVRLLKFLGTLSTNIPLVGYLLRPLMEYLPEWQKTYFHTWVF
uniref:Peroxisomal membrane protein PEX16 n=1 Tax=Ornithodoros turicata TaxID=34597 RepID=A0A2R5LJ45_9ACAR